MVTKTYHTTKDATDTAASDVEKTGNNDVEISFTADATSFVDVDEPSATESKSTGGKTSTAEVVCTNMLPHIWQALKDNKVI